MLSYTFCAMRCISFAVAEFLIPPKKSEYMPPKGCCAVIRSSLCNSLTGKNMSPLKHCNSFTRSLNRKDDNAELHKDATQDPCKMECTYNAPETSLRQGKMLSSRGKMKEVCVRRDGVLLIL